jgi:hypothetical protein
VIGCADAPAEDTIAMTSVRTLQVVFLTCGVVAVMISLPGVPGLATLSWHEVVRLRSRFWDFEAEVQYSTVAYLVLGSGFVIAGIGMQQAVSTHPGWLRWLVIVAALAIVGQLVLHHAASHHLVGFGAPQADLIGTIGGPARAQDITRYAWAGFRLAVLGFLYVSIRRASATHRTSGVAAPARNLSA